ncbi:MAG: hypothetical protein SGPRY_013705, partial [Prymnesium sp.]
MQLPCRPLFSNPTPPYSIRTPSCAPPLPSAPTLQDVYLMLPEDWEKQRLELRRLRRLVVDMLAHTLHNVKHPPDQIVPVMTREQESPAPGMRELTPLPQCSLVIPWPVYIVPLSPQGSLAAPSLTLLSQPSIDPCYLLTCALPPLLLCAMQITPDKTYVVLTGWHRQQCVMVEPHITALDIGVRRGDDIKILDDNLTMQRVWDIAATGGLFGLIADADDDPTEKKLEIGEGEDEEE